MLQISSTTIVSAFESGLARQPELSDPLAYEADVTLGALHFAKGDNDKAMARFERALAAQPGAAAPTLGLAKIHFSKGDVPRALQLFQQVVQSAPGSPEAAEAEVFINELKKPQGVS